MNKQIKDFLSKTKKFLRKKERWQSIAGLLIVGLFVVASAAFNQGVWASFYRTTGATGFSYGYGYSAVGYGYGYGYHRSQNKADYGFSGADGKATGVVVSSVAQTSMTISYSTSYLAKNRIEYGTTDELGTNSPWTAYQSGSNSITISSLTCGTSYHYRVASMDAGGNIWYTTKTTQATNGCGGATTAAAAAAAPTAPTSDTGTVIATPSSGGNTTLTVSAGVTAKVAIPANTLTANTTVTVASSDASAAVEAGTVGESPTALFMVGNTVYNITLVDADGNAVSELSNAATLTFTYTDEQIADLDESTLTVYYWSGTEWVALDSTVNTATNTITATTTHFSYFAIMGQKEAEVSVEEMTKEQLEAKIADIIKQIADVKAKLIALLKTKIAEIAEQIAVLKANLLEMTGVIYEGIPTGFKFESNLSSGMTSNDVKYLQVILKAEIGAPTYPEDVAATGYFGSITKSAVIKFQEKYASEILAPYELTEGTGLVGKTTIAKLNELLLGK